MTPFQKTVLNLMSDKLNHGGAFFAYSCGIENRGKPRAAGRFITGYMVRLVKEGLATKVWTPKAVATKFRITQKGLDLINQENKTLFDNGYKK